MRPVVEAIAPQLRDAACKGFSPDGALRGKSAAERGASTGLVGPTFPGLDLLLLLGPGCAPLPDAFSYASPAV
jgi:hypothetical protein